MCGICGQINYTSKAPVSLKMLARMCEVMSYRGPDDEGYFQDNWAGLGHRRLSIIDIEGGHQPMANEDGSCWLVFNGEIYNFPEIRARLEKSGHRFQTRSDTEAVLHLYEERGAECVTELRGMFAFALWDKQKRRLLLARDRLGQKPLVYTVTPDGLAFASEIKALLQNPCIPREPNLEALHYYLTYQYIPSPHTAFSGIYKLPPAHILIYEAGEVTVQRYWKLEFVYQKMSVEEYKQGILDHLMEATKIRLMSEVPLGAFISGGIDSSAVVAAMNQINSKPVKTFAVGFEEGDFNELPYARIIAERFHTEHHEYMVKPNALEVLPKLVWYYNEPFADPSALPTYYVSQLARREVTVALVGDGGDEAFAGYQRYLADKLAAYYQRLPRILREQLIERVAAMIPKQLPEGSFLSKVRRNLEAFSEPYHKRYLRLICSFGKQERETFYSEEFWNQVKRTDPEGFLKELKSSAPAPDFLGQALWVDIMSYLPDDLLVKVDIASMSNSLETRSPFLDHKFMEFAATIPGELKLKGSTGKYIFRQALAGLLPPQILHRKKAGFSVPVSAWFRGELKEFAYRILLDKQTLARGYFRPNSLKNMLEEHVGACFRLPGPRSAAVGLNLAGTLAPELH